MTRDEFIELLMEETEAGDTILLREDVFQPLLKPSGEVFRQSSDTVIIDVDCAE